MVLSRTAARNTPSAPTSARFLVRVLLLMWCGPPLQRVQPIAACPLLSASIAFPIRPLPPPHVPLPDIHRPITENGPDVAHLNILHRDVAFHAPVLENYMHHEWAASWEPGTGDEAHLAHIKVSQKLNLFGIYVPGSDVKTRITQVRMRVGGGGD